MKRLPSVAILLTVFLCASCDGNRATAPNVANFKLPRSSIVASATSTGAISAGGYHSCALKTDGSVTCWGRNFNGQATPPGGLAAIQLSAGHNHTCALKGDQTVVCWGANNRGQTDVPSGLLANQVSAGFEHTCAVRTDNTVVCWGTPAPVDDKGQTTVPPGLTSVARVVAALEHTCALKIDGTVVCWGSDGNGQTDVPTGFTAVRLNGRWLHSCGVSPDGTSACWGYGPLAAMPPGIDANEISPGNAHTCALRTDGTVTCWGYNAQPQPEDWAQYGQTNVPAGLNSVVQVSSGAFHTCALKADGTVVCWGLNENGQSNVPSGFNVITTQPQAISFTSTPPLSPIVGGTYLITAMGGGSGNPVTFSTLSPATCSVMNAAVSFVAAGPCTIAADQAGNNNYFAAPQATQSVTIGKAPQTINFISSAPASPVVGESYVVTARGGDSGNRVTFASLTPSTCSVSGNTVAFRGPGSCTIAADQSGDDNYDAAPQVTQRMTVIELNVAPVVNRVTLPAGPVQKGTRVGVAGNFTDGNVHDAHTATVAWGDGVTTTETIIEGGGAGTVSGDHAYAASGVYTVIVSVSDGSFTGRRSSELDVPAYVVVYDPSAGFVTGGGWITSPQGSYAANPILTGKASFGFVSQYKKGATVPTGNTQFQFETAGLNFASTAFQWLVVSGSKAQFKGTGEINGAGGYGFLLSAVDGQVSGGQGVDRFRIKIWEIASGTIVYDNQMGAGDDAVASTALGGGSIVIHQ